MLCPYTCMCAHVVYIFHAYMCARVCKYVCMHLCLYGCIYMHCLDVCMYLYIYAYIITWANSQCFVPSITIPHLHYYH